jgi:TPR repeat protein
MKGIAILSTLLLFTLTSATAAQKTDALPILATGTGFFITEDGYLLTNNHVIDGASVITVKIDGKELPAKIIKVDEQNDLAVLKVEGKFPALPVISSKKVGLGDEVFTVGFPQVGVQGYLPKLTTGNINSLAGINDDARNFQISVPIQPGNSGGPLVDEYGNVIGVVVARLNALKLLKERGSIPQNVNYAVKGSFAGAFLESLPNVARKLKDAKTRAKTRKFPEVAQEVQAATVLILINEMATGDSHIADADRRDTLPKDIPSLKALAEKGDALAQNVLGERYFFGNGVPKDVNEALKWIRKSALQGESWGQYNLGVMYRDGNGVLKDNKQAFNWFLKSGEQGYARAQTEVGLSAMTGRGVPKDNKEAVKWLRKAAEQRNALAAYFLAKMYYNGWGVLEDDKEAFKWYLVSAEEGDEDSQAQVGFMLLKGVGVRENDREAVKVASKSCQPGTNRRAIQPSICV